MEGLQTYVADGEPCPRHPAEVSRLMYVPGAGLHSQCAVCREDFLAWYAQSFRDPPPPRADGAPLPALASKHARPKVQQELAL